MTAPGDLHTYLHLLQQADQLAEVPVAVDPHLELAAIVDRLVKGAVRGRAALFREVLGTQMPVAANLFGTVERVGWALGTTDLEGEAERLARDLRGTGLADPDRALAALCEAAGCQPGVCAAAPCREADHTRRGLAVLPQVRGWPQDGGCYLTLAQVATRGPCGGRQNWGMYRVQLLDDRHAAIRCRPGSGMAAHLAEWQAAGRSMPVAVVLGGPPALTWACGAPLPAGIDEAAFCGYLTGERLPMIESAVGGLLLPAMAEVVIEGEIAPGAQAQEGPFGNHTGYYDPPGRAPLLSVLQVTARRDAICPWTLVGPPPMEDISLARASERLLLPLVRHGLPEVRDIHMPDAGIFHRAALVQVAAAERRALPELAEALWTTALLRGARLLVLCSDDTELRAAADVYWRGLNRVDWSRDLYRHDDRLAVDLRQRPAAAEVIHPPELIDRVLRRWPELGLGREGT